jgi:hypothetical protein
MVEGCGHATRKHGRLYRNTSHLKCSEACKRSITVHVHDRESTWLKLWREKKEALFVSFLTNALVSKSLDKLFLPTTKFFRVPLIPQHNPFLEGCKHQGQSGGYGKCFE